MAQNGKLAFKAYSLIILGFMFFSNLAFSQYSKSTEVLNFEGKVYKIFIDRESNQIIWPYFMEKEYGIYLGNKKIVFEKQEVVYDFKYGLIAVDDVSEALQGKTLVKIYKVEEREIQLVSAIKINGRYTVPQIINEDRILVQKYGEGSIDFTCEMYDLAGNLIVPEDDLPINNYSAIINSNRNSFFLYSVTNPSELFDNPQDVYIYKINSTTGSTITQAKINNDVVYDVVAEDELLFAESNKRIIAYDTTLSMIWENKNIIPTRITLCRGTKIVCVTTQKGVFFLNTYTGNIEYSITFDEILRASLGGASIDDYHVFINDMTFNPDTKKLYLALAYDIAEMRNLHIISIHLPSYALSEVAVYQFSNNEQIKLLTFNNDNIKVITTKLIHTIIDKK